MSDQGSALPFAAAGIKATSSTWLTSLLPWTAGPLSGVMQGSAPRSITIAFRLAWSA
ncbi:hypothetical protein CHLRE_16g685949v5 [Chlamydomonas reinhardtii]|uniref:Uncharacterized protein n=1 Tax=Chlamydomonas reinhardtii TaxID=3055 RepID=A0A2K3CW41_CHLRE|nr:uncharacterized protein CHLRE_16g685949v5 [Chlamydomonas reinhardtii]XP_042916285.1 uncharacterized protein CHLRE_16g685949v5 [Chlamydomonas reinhardtii]XP_042916286.1 uncharacterized protein CHLRE_16g685949v5 [Chlamydomonas reinhardtii]PNW72497.1 hypothetical protein CHLRE_16g685949v5 [Chlamydomonas reinhardtii]PNW72498.1 hypothetical protein CHLRE_16g685949v5 [Chlamydomonas reinhardtii]PNW72499.1 hypothetical protein CHLRE_16g685949v5 [Chlamydomonas reinhardtii]